MRTIMKLIKAGLWLLAAIITLPLALWVRLWSLRGGDTVFQFASQFM